MASDNNSRAFINFWWILALTLCAVAGAFSADTGVFPELCGVLLGWVFRLPPPLGSSGGLVRGACVGPSPLRTTSGDPCVETSGRPPSRDKKPRHLCVTASCMR